MKRVISLILSAAICLACLACGNTGNGVDIVATTLPVYDITVRLCENTNLSVGRLISENVSCLHDYTLNPIQMKLAESAELLVISGVGFEDFMADVIGNAGAVADASVGVTLHSTDHGDTHSHEHDPHIWLSPVNGKLMAGNIYATLCQTFPEHTPEFTQNFYLLQEDFDRLAAYANSELSDLSCRDLITFHDGFGYMAESFDLTIARSIEEESGSEASARDLISICEQIEEQNIPAIFIEKNGSDRAATIVSQETGAKIYTLDTSLSGTGYFDAMYHNITTLKEALG